MEPRGHRVNSLPPGAAPPPSKGRGPPTLGTAWSPISLPSDSAPSPPHPLPHPHPRRGGYGCVQGPEFTPKRGRRSLNLFVCSSLSLHASPLLRSAVCPGPSEGGSGDGQPDASLAAVAGPRRFNGALWRRAPLPAAPAASPQEVGALPCPGLASGPSLPAPGLSFCPLHRLCPFATTEGNQKSGNWGQGE